MKNRAVRNYKRKIAAVLALVCAMGMILGGSIFKTPEMTLDTEKQIVYQGESLENLLIRKGSNPASAEAAYLNRYIMLEGKIRVKSSDNKQLRLGALTEYVSDILECNTSDISLINVISGLTIGDTVRVCGKITKNLLDGKWSMTPDRIMKTDKVGDLKDVFMTADGTDYDAAAMISRSLNDGKISFRIPGSWSSVEKNLVETGLGSMEGYQYCLNEINEQSVQPESFFICYFDNDKHLLKSSDKESTELIERAIVKNILKQDLGAAQLKKKTIYGANYHYYQGAYKTAFGQNYHAEFVFQPVGTQGFVVYLYIFREKLHLNDIMITMRLLEIG